MESATQLGLSREDLLDQLSALAKVIGDAPFIAQMLAINARIDTLSEDN